MQAFRSLLRASAPETVQALPSGTAAAVLHHHKGIDCVLSRADHVRQSYGIKVGYGAGGAGQTVRPGEPPAPKSSSCC